MKKICLMIFIGVSLFSCSKGEMDRTIFIPDDDDATLPAYTEWGYNSFGAEYDRDYFLVSNSIAPCKITYRNNQLQFALFGVVHSTQKEMTLQFTIPTASPMKDLQDLLLLHNRKISIPDSCSVKISQSTDTVITVIGGELYFKRAQLLSIDDQMNRIILSGTFDLQLLKDGFPVTISNGRFDVGIPKKVFFSY